MANGGAGNNAARQVAGGPQQTGRTSEHTPAVQFDEKQSWLTVQGRPVGHLAAHVAQHVVPTCKAVGEGSGKRHCRLLQQGIVQLMCCCNIVHAQQDEDAPA